MPMEQKVTTIMSAYAVKLKRFQLKVRRVNRRTLGSITKINEGGKEFLKVSTAMKIKDWINRRKWEKIALKVKILFKV